MIIRAPTIVTSPGFVHLKLGPFGSRVSSAMFSDCIEFHYRNTSKSKVPSDQCCVIQAPFTKQRRMMDEGNYLNDSVN